MGKGVYPSDKQQGSSDKNPKYRDQSSVLGDDYVGQELRNIANERAAKKKVGTPGGSPTSESTSADPLADGKSPLSLDGQSAPDLFDFSPAEGFVVGVADRQLDLTGIDPLPGPYTAEEKDKARRSLSEKVNNRMIDARDAVVLATADPSLTAEEVYESVNKPQKYEFSKAARKMDEQLDKAFNLMDQKEKPEFKRRVLNDDKMLQDFYKKRSEQYQDQLKQLGEQLDDLSETQSISTGIGGATTSTMYKDPVRAKQIEAEKKQIVSDLNALKDSYAKIQSFNFQRDLARRGVELDDTTAEQIGARKKEILDPVGAANDQKRLSAGFQLNERTRFSNAQAAIADRVAFLAAQLEDANDARKNSPSKESEERFLRIQDQFYTEYERLTKLSDKYPEVRRAEKLQASLEAYNEIANTQRALRGVSPLAYGSPGFLRNLAGYIFNETPETESEWKQISARTGISVEELKKLDKDTKGIRDSNIRTTGLLSAIASSADQTIKGVQSSFNRWFGSGTDVEKDMYSEKLEGITEDVARRASDELLFQPATTIDMDKGSATFGRTIRNERAGQFNINPASFVNVAGETTAQLAIFAAGGRYIGGAVGATGKAIGNAALGNSELAAFQNAYRLAEGANKARIAGEYAGTMATGFAMSYDQHYRELGQYTTDETRRHLGATVNAAIEGAVELMNLDANIVRSFRGDVSRYKIFDKLLDAKKGVLTNDVVRQYAGAMGKMLGDMGAEGAEEFLTEWGQAIATSATVGKPVDIAETAQRAKEAFVTTFIGMVPTAAGAGFRGMGKLHKDVLYEAGAAPGDYASWVADQVTAGKMDQAKADKAMQTINTMADIVQKLPKQNSQGKPLSDDQLVELAAQEYRNRVNKKIQAESSIEAEKIQAEADSQEAIKAQQEIISPELIEEEEGEEEAIDLDKLMPEEEQPVAAPDKTVPAEEKDTTIEPEYEAGDYEKVGKLVKAMTSGSLEPTPENQQVLDKYPNLVKKQLDIEKSRREEIDNAIPYIPYNREQEVTGEHQWQRDQAKEFNADVRGGLLNNIKLKKELQLRAEQEDNKDLAEVHKRALDEVENELKQYDEINARYDAEIQKLFPKTQTPNKDEKTQEGQEGLLTSTSPTDVKAGAASTPAPVSDTPEDGSAPIQSGKKSLREIPGYDRLLPREKEAIDTFDTLYRPLKEFEDITGDTWKAIAQVLAVASVNGEVLITGKFPNGKRLTQKERLQTLGEIEEANEVLPELYVRVEEERAKNQQQATETPEDKTEKEPAASKPKPKTPKKAAETDPNKPKKGRGRPRTRPEEAVAPERDPESIEEAILQFFNAGGKIFQDDFIRSSGFGGTSAYDGRKKGWKELFGKSWALSTEAGTNVKRLDILAAELADQFGGDEQDIMNEIVDALSSYTKKQMIERLIDIAESGNDQQQDENDLEQREQSYRDQLAAFFPEVDEAIQQEIISVLRPFQNQYGFVNWDQVFDEMTGFNPDFLDLSDQAAGILMPVVKANMSINDLSPDAAPASTSQQQDAPTTSPVSQIGSMQPEGEEDPFPEPTGQQPIEPTPAPIPAPQEAPAPAPVEMSELEKKRQKLAEAKAKLNQVWKNNRNSLNSGVNPELILAGVEVLAALADLGMTKFREFVREMGEMDRSYLDTDNVNVLGNIYAFHRRELPREVRAEYDTDDQIDDFIAEELPEMIKFIESNENTTTDGTNTEDTTDTEGGTGSLRPDVTGTDIGGQPDLVGSERDGRDTADQGSGTEVTGQDGGDDERGLQPSGGQGDSVAGNNSSVRNLTSAQSSRNYRYPADYKEPTTFNKRQRIQDNIMALRKLVDLKLNRRLPTPEDQEVLARYVGWGGLKQITLNPDRDEEWQVKSDQPLREPVREVIQLINTLDPTGEYLRKARESVANAHYTSPTVIRSIYKAIDAVDFKGGAILEPSAGIGNFLSAMPEHIAARSTITAVELDPLTGLILQNLHPRTDVRISGLQDAKLPQNHYDLIVSNVPFGDYGVTDKGWAAKDKKYREAASSIHNYFFAKSMELLRPGGVMAMITSRYTLDSQSSKNGIMALLQEQGKILGAVRLPGNAFKGIAGTEVVTDIIFVQKLAEGEAPVESSLDFSIGRKYVQVDGKSVPVEYSRYFIENPGQMLGIVTAGGLYSENEFYLEADESKNLQQQLDNALRDILPDSFGRPPSETQETPERKEQLAANRSAFLEGGNKIGSMVMIDANTAGRITGEYYEDHELNDRLWEEVGVRPDKVRENRLTWYEEEQFRNAGFKYEQFNRRVLEPIKLGKDKLKMAEPLIRIRKGLMELLNAEVNDLPENVIEDLRSKLRFNYNAFVKRFGFLNDKDPRYVLSFDADQFAVLSLERKENPMDKNSRWVGSDILNKRTINPLRRATQAATLRDAVLISLQESGSVDLKRIAALLNKDPQDILKEQQSAENEAPVIYETQNGQLVTAEEYLSGNVRNKLAQAKEMMDNDARFSNNVRDLEKVQPEKIPAVDIFIKAGAEWVPTKYFEQFLSKVFNNRTRISFKQSDGSFHVSYDRGTPEVQAFQTKRKGADFIAEALLNGVTPTIRYTIKIGDSSTTHIDEEDTQLAKDLLGNLQSQWDNFWQDDPEIRTKLEELYNEHFNNTKLRTYDGSHLSFPGMQFYQPRPHQADAVWRNLMQLGGINDHIVGGGKTLIQVATAMEGRRLGLMKKPMIIGLKSQVPQLYEEFLRAYPMAKVLFATEKDFEKGNRKQFLNSIATNDWDAIIMGHSQFDRILQNPEIAAAMQQELLDALEDELAAATTKDEKTSIQKQIQKYKKKIEELMEAAKDYDALRFDQLGVDFLMVDESQEYKNLEFTTRESNIKGLGNPEGSKRAFNMLLATRHLQNLHGADKGVLFASGTPIANSMSEMYLLFKYLIPTKMREEWGVKTFDQFKKIFAITDTQLEFYMGKFQSVTRLRKFSNLPELITTYREIADVRNAQNLVLDRPKANHHLVKVMPDETQLEYMKKLLLFMDTKGNAYAEELGLTAGFDEKKGKNPAFAALAVTFSKKLSMDARIVDPKNPPSNKLKAAADNIARIHEETAEHKGVQLIFSDMGTPKSQKPVVNFFNYMEDSGIPLDTLNEIFGENFTEATRMPKLEDVMKKAAVVLEIPLEEVQSMQKESESFTPFTVYEEMRKLLIERGIPEEQIEFIHDHDSGKKRMKLYERVNDGEVRILLGSTKKLGTGVNVQRRAVAGHHLDIQWRPSDMEQRNGRIERQGNIIAKQFYNNQVNIYYYATERLMDAEMYQLVGQKGEMIASTKVNGTGARSIEDISGEIDMSSMAANLTGDKRILEMENAKRKLKELQLKEANWRRARNNASELIRNADTIINSRKEGLIALREALPILEANPIDEKTKEYVFDAEIKGVPYESVTEAGQAMVEWAKLYGPTLKREAEVNIGSVYGFKINAYRHWGEDKNILIRLRTPSGALVPTDQKELDSLLSTQSNPASLFSLRVKKILISIPNLITRFENSIASNEEDKIKYAKQLEQKFENSEEMAQLASTISRLGNEIAESQKAERAAIRDEMRAENEEGDIPDDYEVNEDPLRYGHQEYKSELLLPNSPKMVERMEFAEGRTEGADLYFTENGETIVYEQQLSLFGDEANQPVPTPQEEAGIGEFVAVERKLVTEGRFEFFTRNETIRDFKDVAYMFRQLETEAVEHAFAVLVDGNGNYKTAWLGMGTSNSTQVDVPALAALVKMYPETKTIYFVHNHPSGGLKPSRADFTLVKRMKEFFAASDINVINLIMNLYGGYYARFDDSGYIETYDREAPQGTDVAPVEVVSFTKLTYASDFDYPYITSTTDAVSFVSKIRFGVGDKLGVLFIAGQGKIGANFFINPNEDLATQIVAFGGRHNAMQAILYGNITDKKFIERVKAAKKSISENVGFNLLDYITVSGSPNNIHNYDSLTEQGLLSEDQPPYVQKKTLADKIRQLKIPRGYMLSTILPAPAVWNAAVDLVANAIQGGTAMLDAMRMGYDYIRKNYKEVWSKGLYHKQMMAELKNRGVFSYNLTPTQQKEADKIIRSAMKGNQFVAVMEQLKNAYADRMATMQAAGALQADIDKVADQYKEIERYVLDGIVATTYDQMHHFNMDLKDMTMGQRIKKQVQNRMLRLEQAQAAADEAIKTTPATAGGPVGTGITDDTDAVNKADRWRSIAETKVNRIMARIGIAGTDTLFGRGRKRIDDSLFDSMAKDGIDYRKLNLFMYALHAPERNAHNAKKRREQAATYLMQLEQDYEIKANQVQAIEEAILIEVDPLVQIELRRELRSATGVMKRFENRLTTMQQYMDNYGTTNVTQNYIRILEAKIPKKYHLMDDGGSGMTNKQAQDILDQVALDGLTTKYEMYANAFRDLVIQPALEMQLEYGMLDFEQFYLLRDYYKHYVPLTVDDEYFEDEESYTSKGLPGATIWRSKGADYINYESRVNPITSAIERMQGVVYRGEKNAYLISLARLVEAAPDDKVWSLVNAEYKITQGKDGRVVGRSEVEQPENYVPFMDGGQKKYIVINDPELLKAVTEADVKKAIPVLGKINSIFRSFATLYNPNFIFANLFRDLEAAGLMLTAEQSGTTRKEFLKNLAQLRKIMKGSYAAQTDRTGTKTNQDYWEKVAQEYRELGGTMSWWRPESSEQIRKDIEQDYEEYQKDGGFEAGKRLSIAVFDWFNRVNNSIEETTRLAVYDAAVKAGMSKQKAVELARNITVNFNKKGNLGATMDSLYLFANASIQGSTNVLRAMIFTKKGRWLASGLIMMGAMQSLINNFLSDCNDPQNPEDCYDNIQEYEKDKYIVIKTPGAKGFTRIPFSYGFNVFYYFGEQLGQLFQGKTDVMSATVRTGVSIINNFNPIGSVDQGLLQAISPTAADPVVQYYTNQDALGRPIFPDYEFDKRPDSQKAFKSDSDVSKEFAAWLNKFSGGNQRIKGKIDVSPGTLDWLASTVFGGTGNFIKQIATVTDASYDWAINNEPLNVQTKDIPLVGRFYSLPKAHSDRDYIYRTLDDSHNTILAPATRQKVEAELNRAVELGEIRPDKADQYRRKINRNQVELSSPFIMEFMEEAKTRIIPDREKARFIKEMERKVRAKELTETDLKSYKSRITKSQNEIKRK